MVLTKVFEGHGPIGDPRIPLVFVPPEHVGLVAIALGLGFGFLSYSGFEQSATLGEEVVKASRTIPRVLVLTVLIVGITCTVISAAEVLGFGVTEADMARFTSSSSLLGDLATIYAGRGIGDVFDIFAMLSALGTCWPPPPPVRGSCSRSCEISHPRAHWEGSRAIPERRVTPHFSFWSSE